MRSRRNGMVLIAEVARAFGLGPGRPISEDEGGHAHIIQCADEFYM